MRVCIRKPLHFFYCLLTLALMACVVHCESLTAQDVSQAPVAGAGSVYGHVYYADTQKPARYVQVRLVPLRAAPNQHSAGGPGAGVLNGFSATGVDGSFTMTNVQPGNYFVEVTAPGYVSPLRMVSPDGTPPTPEQIEKAGNLLTKVSVAANQQAMAQVTLYRGATLTGLLNYDDGSPAAGLQVSAMEAVPSALPNGGGVSSANAAGGSQPVTLRHITATRTDDRGQFRLTGLPTGSYTVQARNSGVRGSEMFPVYLGNTVHGSEAKLVEVKAGDERDGLDLMVTVNGLRQLSGVVQAAKDGHPLPQTTVVLSLTGESGESLNAISGADGSFRFKTVQDGKYTVSASSASDSHPTFRRDDRGPAQTSTDAGATYGAAFVNVEVHGGDVDNVVLNLPLSSASTDGSGPR